MNALIAQGFISSWVSDFSTDQRFVIVLVLIGCATLVAAVTAIAVATAWESVRSRESRLELTRDLLDQGKSADEIERIVNPSDGFTRSLESWFGGRCRKG